MKALMVSLLRSFLPMCFAWGVAGTFILAMVLESITRQKELSWSLVWMSVTGPLMLSLFFAYGEKLDKVINHYERQV
jgi:hypothetical protein